MSLLARALSYLAALTLAVAAIAPWVERTGRIGVATPTGVAVVLGLAVAVVLSTVLRRRSALSIVGVLTASLAVYVIWTAPDGHLLPRSGAPIEGTGLGLRAIMFAAVLAFAASWLPSPGARARVRVKEQG